MCRTPASQCEHNAGRSQIARLSAHHLSNGWVGVRCAGSYPAVIDPVVVEALVCPPRRDPAGRPLAAVRYPGSHPITMSYTGDRRNGKLLGAQLVGTAPGAATRIDIPATAIFNELTIDQLSDLDLSYAPPLGSPWDALQTGAQAWTRSVCVSATR